MAEKKFYVDIQLSGNQLKNVRAELLAVHPALAEGRYYYNTTDKKLYYCNGTEWVSGGEITSVTAASSKVSVTNTDGAITIDIVEANITHANIADSGSVTHELIDDHILGTNDSGTNLTPSNPHETSIADVLAVNTDAGDRKITGLADATAPTDAVNLQTLQALVNAGVIWQNPVKDIVDTLPLVHTAGDRFILSTDDKIYTSNGTTFDTGTTPLASWAVSVITDTLAPTNAVGKYVFNGTDWVNIQTTLERHDQLDGVLGGGQYHLTQAEKETLTGTNGIANADTLHKHGQQSRNGLSVNADYNELGGTLIKNTVVDADGFNFEVRRAGSIILETVVADQKTSLNIAPSGLEFGTENTLNQTRSYVGFNTTEAALINETGGVETKISVKDSEAVIASTSASFAGIKYAANYAENFTALSLVHKAYVDGAIQGAIAAIAVTSGNGLTTNTGIIELGGTVTKDTVVSVAASKTLSFGGAGAKNLKQVDAFGTHTIGVDSTGITIESRNDQNEQQFAFKTIAGLAIIGSELLDFSGVSYLDDYSANFGNRSLVDKGYVDTKIATRQANIEQEITANTPYVFINPFNNPNVIMSIVDVADGASVVCSETILAGQITIESNVTFTARITVISMVTVVEIP